MTDWGAGYVTDVEYMAGYFRFQSPAHQAVACLMGGVACDIFDRYDHLSYMELGCGLGFGAMVLAACNPGWTVTAVDFNPAHIASARSFAEEAGLENIRFIEADLSTLAESPRLAEIPEVDVVSMHGVWSWVPRAVQLGIVRLLAAKLRAGGLAHLSYNALPAWQPALGLQRLVRETGQRLAGRSDRQAAAGFDIAHKLSAADAGQLKTFPFVQALLERAKVAPVEYLAHEYINEHWRPCFHTEVARDLAEAKLSYVAAGELIENFPALAFTEAQREIVDKFDDPLVRELIKDMCLSRGLRHDIFVRGARRITGTARNAALSRLRLMLTVTPEDFQYEADMPTGHAEFSRSFYGNVVEALAERPRLVGELAALPGRDSDVENPAELLAIMIGSDQATLMLRPEASVDERAKRFNAVAARRMMRVDRIGQGAAMASVRLGDGLRAPLLDLYLADRARQSACGTVSLDAAALAAELGGRLEPEEQEKLRSAIERTIEKRAGLWRRAGAI
jgi:SAM-dependent methyltransferase